MRVIDFETTGTEPPEAEVCEIGWTDIVDGVVQPPVSRLCRVDQMSPIARAVHHISAEDTASFAPFDEAEVIVPVPLIAHNAAFEQKFAPSAQFLCSYKSALHVWPEAPSHANGALFYWLWDQGLIAPERALAEPAHRAGPDSYMTAHIVVAMLAAGASAEEIARWTDEPRRMPVVPLGKYRDKPWADADTGYLQWMAAEDGMDPDIRFHADKELKRRMG